MTSQYQLINLTRIRTNKKKLNKLRNTKGEKERKEVAPAQKFVTA